MYQISQIEPVNQQYSLIIGGNTEQKNTLKEYTFDNNPFLVTPIIPPIIEALNNFPININIKLKPMIKLAEISNLQPNWGGYNEKPINSKIIDIAKNIILRLCAEPEIFPVADGSINFEFYDDRDDNRCLIFGIYTDKVNIFYYISEDQTFSLDIPIDDIKQMNEFIGQFYESCGF